MLINFHHFHSDEIPEYTKGTINVKHFENFIIKFKNNIINFKDWLLKYKLNQLKKEIAITLDDGLLCQYKLALPILNKYNIQAGWGICSAPLVNKPIFLEINKYFQGFYFDNIDEFYDLFYKIILRNAEYKKYIKELNNIKNINNYRKHLSFYTFSDRKFRYIRDLMSESNDFDVITEEMMKIKKCDKLQIVNKIWINKKQLLILSKSQSILSHSHTHPTIMDKLNYILQENEINTSIQIIESIINKKINIFCCPCDNFNKDTIQILKKLNILCLVGKNNNNFKNVITRIDCNEFMSKYLDPSAL